MSECRVTKNTANDTYFPILFFYFSNIIVERFKTTLTSDDAKQKKWFMIPKVASNEYLLIVRFTNDRTSLDLLRLCPNFSLESGA